MGASPDLLASWNETLESEGSLCDWRPKPSAISCDNITGAITEMQVWARGTSVRPGKLAVQR